MAEVKPFNGLLYNPEKVTDMAAVMAPPYDVITPEFQETLYNRHLNNVVRLILNKTTPEDTPGSDRYSRAAAELERWLDEGVMKRDKEPAVYYYTQGYTLKDGLTRTRKGFIALVRLEEFGEGGILPHERTLTGPKADRLNLIKACRANFSCIFSLYPESGVTPEEKINAILDKTAAAGEGEGGPLMEVKGDDNVTNRLWRITDPGVIEKVTQGMQSKTLFIADGHHRYETALNYRNHMNETIENPTGEEPFNYIMMYLTAMDTDGLDVFPTHRVIHSLEGFDGETFLDVCQEYFDLEELKFEEATEPAARQVFLKTMAEAEGGEGAEGGPLKVRFGLYLANKKSYFILTLKTIKLMDELFGDTIADVYKSLDITVLHSLIFKNILGITQEDQEAQRNLVYVKGFDEALEAGGVKQTQMVFLMNPTKVEQVKAVSEAGLLMPQKSTYFYPKLLSGPVINLLY